MAGQSIDRLQKDRATNEGVRVGGVSFRNAQFHVLAYFLQSLRSDLESHFGEVQLSRCC